MKVAIIHDWLEKKGGAEKVLEELFYIYPKADLFVIVDFMKDKEKKFLKKIKIKKSFIQYLPFSKIFFRYYFFLMPIAIRLFNLSKYDLIISSSHSYAKNIVKRKNQKHICYCHTPIRYAHVMMENYIVDYGFKNKFLRFFLSQLLLLISKWDIKSNLNVDYFISNSTYIQKRILKIYKRNSEVIHPPIDTKKFSFKKKKDNFYMTASRLVPYKKVDLIVKAFNKMPSRKLIVIGDGPQLNKIKKLALSNINIIGWVNDNYLIKLMKSSKAFIFAPLEDFGIVPVEAQSCGTPVIAYGKGGVTDTIIVKPLSRKTGIFFKYQKTKSIIKSVELFEKINKNIDALNCRKNAKNFSRNIFRQKMKKFIKAKVLD